MGCFLYDFTFLPCCCAGFQFGLFLMISTAASRNSSGPSIASISLTVPSLSTINCAITVPWMFFRSAFFGYTRFSCRNFVQPVTPPGNVDSISTLVSTLSLLFVRWLGEAVCAQQQEHAMQTNNRRQVNFMVIGWVQ